MNKPSKIYEELSEALRYHSLNKIRLAGYIYSLKEGDAYQDVVGKDGQKFETWSEFVKHGVKWSVRKCDSWARTFKIFIVDRKMKVSDIEDVDMTNLTDISSHITAENEKELLAMAREMSNRELKIALKLKSKNIGDIMDCKHQWEYWVGRVCSECGVKENKKLSDKLENYFK